MAEVPGIPDARFWGDAVPPLLDRQVRTMSKDEVREAFPALYGRPHHYLAISGGGANGAFGAGLLVGWTQAGNRPEFQMVTGISTGALIAPFAFIGTSHDHVLNLYNTISTKDVMRERSQIKAFSSDAAADSAPLFELIQKIVDDDVIDAIAAGHRSGRGLYIGTTDLDRMRPMIWDIGAIAASGQPGAKDLVHRIMLASASIPGVFPPVRIEVELDGQRYEELHVDGGAAAQVFVYPAKMNWRRVLELLDVPEKPDIYVIRNSPLETRQVAVEQKLLPIVGRSISSLIRTQGIGDLYQIYLLCERDGANYHLATIPDDFTEEPGEAFDRVYMNKLFAHANAMAQKGYPWETKPPGFNAGADAGKLEDNARVEPSGHR